MPSRANTGVPTFLVRPPAPADARPGRTAARSVLRRASPHRRCRDAPAAGGPPVPRGAALSFPRLLR
eukprot:7465746-Pyramimonas_sp.AAC.1